jgi:membrane protein YqaA with SNARE-associated domain
MLDFFIEFFSSFGLIGLFLISFFAATILPLSSEAVLWAFIKQNQHSFSTLLIIASLGNILGGTTNYFLGLLGQKLFVKKINAKSSQIANKYGVFAAFFSWIPIIGDPILIALGVFTANFWKTFFMMSIGKIGRYLLVFLI